MKVRVTLVYYKSPIEVTTWPSWEAAMAWVRGETLPLQRVEVIVLH